VCAVIRRKTDNSVLFCHRKGYSEDEGWQFPQGGIDITKDLIEELKRELLEEIGTDDITVIYISPYRYIYKFSEDCISPIQGYDGQQQQWVLVEFNKDEIEISFIGAEQEFDAYKWVSPEYAYKTIVEFKKEVYYKGLRDLGLIKNC